MSQRLRRWHRGDATTVATGATDFFVSEVLRVESKQNVSAQVRKALNANI